VDGGTVVQARGGGAGPPDPAAGAANLDERLQALALARGLVTQVQARDALDEARRDGVALLEVLRRRGLVAEEAARDLDEEVREDFLPGYRVLDKLGEGGMGVVYKALQKRLDRTVALKVVMPRLANDASYLKRFEREAKAVARLNHPNIVAAYDYGESNGRVFLAMEFVEGKNLAEVIRTAGALEPDRALGIVRDVAAGLAHAHAAGIIHRDIKPANILLADRRPGDTASGTAAGAKVTDLGLARFGDQAGASELTAAGTILGTPGYMAPEQAFGGEVDHRADIYALGATLYQLVTGDRPFEASTPLGVLARQQADRLDDPRDRAASVPDGMAALLQGMLSRSPATRYPDYRSLLQDIDRVRDGGAPVLPEPPPADRTLAPRRGGAAAGGTEVRPRAVSDRRAATVITGAPGAGAPAAPAGSASPPPPAGRSRAPLLVGGVLLVAAVAAALILRPGGGDGKGAGAGAGTGGAGTGGGAPAPAVPGGGAPSEEAMLPAGEEEAFARDLDGGREVEGAARLRAARARWKGLPEADRARLAGSAGRRLDGMERRLRDAAKASVTRSWKEGEYEEGLRRARAVEEALGDATGDDLRGLRATLEAIGPRGREERAAILEARRARLAGDPLGALAALDGFEERYGGFSPDLEEARAVLAWADAEAPEVTVEVTPADARVLVAGRDAGPPPRRMRLPLGGVPLEATAGGYRPISTLLDVARGGPRTFRFTLEPVPRDPEPAVLLERTGDEIPLWTVSLGAWSGEAGEWSLSDADAKARFADGETTQPPSNLRGLAKAGVVATTLRRAPASIRGTAGWRLACEAVGERRATGETARVELQFAEGGDGWVLVLGLDDQEAYLGRRNRASGELRRTHALRGPVAGAPHTLVVENHGGVLLGFVDGKRVGSVAAPAGMAADLPFRLAVEGGVGYFSGITLQPMAAAK
jgi:predicted Ser/Thr protein kinase